MNWLTWLRRRLHYTDVEGVVISLILGALLTLLLTVTLVLAYRALVE